jgi:hypothetical protein
MSFIAQEKITVVHPDDTDKPEAEQRAFIIRKKMNQGQRAKFQNETMAIHNLTGACSNDQYDLLLLSQNLLKWQGPGYSNVKLTPEKIMELDFDDDLVRLAIKTIEDNNRRKVSPDPKSESDDSQTDLSSPDLDTTGSSDDGETT